MYDRPADYYFATPELRLKLILASECPTTVNKSDGRTRATAEQAYRKNVFLAI
jgi:hypothetical protein